MISDDVAEHHNVANNQRDVILYTMILIDELGRFVILPTNVFSRIFAYL